MVRLTGNSGKSMEDAIIILEASNNLEGIAAEYTYLQNTYGRKDQDWKLIRQSLNHSGAKHYDEMRIRLATGETIIIYFDITSFYGRF